MQTATMDKATPSHETKVDLVPVGAFLEGLYASCQMRHDSDTCHEIVDDTQTLLTDAGFDSLAQVAHQQLAEIIFSATRAWEYVGPDGTIPLVAEQRDYTRSVVGDTCFWMQYDGLSTVDGRSYYAPMQ
jgi:hypothetical protein